MERQIVQWFFFLVYITASNCMAQPYFFRKDIPVGQAPETVFVGDFNGDHRPDLGVNSAFGLTPGVSILLNTGGGNFGRPIKAGVVVRATPEHPMVADVNGDGKDDLVIGQAIGAGGGVFLSRGDGTFQPAPQIGAGSLNIAAVGNLNSDGKIDLLVSEPNAGTRVLLGNGDGTFQAGASLAAQSALAAVVADVNRDGRNDVVCQFQGSANPVVFLGKGDGTFAAGIEIVATGGDPVGSIRPSIFVADFNDDGIPDLALPQGILLGNGDGSFQSTLISYPWSGKVAIPRFVPLVYGAADLTGDRKTDLLVRILGPSNTVSIYPGKGDATFSAPLEQAGGWGFTSPTPDSPVAPADLDGDGRTDLVIVNGASQTLSVLLARAQDGPSLRRAVSTASGTAIVAPRSLASLLAPTPVTESVSAVYPQNPPTSLGGISLNVRDSGGAIRSAPLFYVSGTQTNFQVPDGTSLGEASLSIVDSHGSTEAGSMQVDAVAPGIFTLSPGSAIPAATAMLVLGDGTQIPMPVYTCAPTPQGISCNAAPIPLSIRSGTVYVSFYGTGFAGVNPNSVIITDDISEVRLPVLYAGPTEIPGLDLINVRVVPEAFNSYNYLELRIQIDGILTNFVALSTQ